MEVGQVGVVLIAMPLLLIIDQYITNGARSAKLVYALSAGIALLGVYWILVRLEFIA